MQGPYNMYFSVLHVLPLVVPIETKICNPRPENAITMINFLVEFITPHSSNMKLRYAVPFIGSTCVPPQLVYRS